MDENLAAANAALQAGRGAEAIGPLIAAVQAEPNRPVQVYRTLLMQLYHAGRLEEGVAWGETAMARFPRDHELMNLVGVFHRRLKDYPRARATLERAAKLAPANVAIMQNLGNVLLDLDEAAAGEAVFAKLVRAQPRSVEYIRQLGRALMKQGKMEAAATRFRQALGIDKSNVDAWMDLASVDNNDRRTAEAEATIDKALDANPDSIRLLEAKAMVMRRGQAFRRAEAYLLDLLPRYPEAGWIHYQLGVTVADYKREQANEYFRKAIALEPDRLEYMMMLIEGLERTRTGDEGANIEESYQLALKALAHKPTNEGHLKILNEVFIRVCAFDQIAQLGSFEDLGRGWARTGRHSALLKQLAQVKSLDDRYELMRQHRLWGENIEKEAARHPLRRPKPRPADGKIRLGFLSSDLRAHPVGYFALPLFEHVDPRFELYCYSFYQGQPDRLYEFFASKSQAYRWDPELGMRESAQMVCDDQLDMLIELGGTTHMNRLEVMAWKPAPRQASWLGYPHSAGLAEIDYLLTDPYNTPPRADLLLEKPLMMPKSWIALGRMVFSDNLAITPGLPQDRAGGTITFGTANNPHKYNRETIELWARVMREVPNSRFLFVRPEGSGIAFRANIRQEFERHGVPSQRILFHAVRGRHMPVYNEIDITLDPVPLTGGTTTTESLWMGVPVVSLIGEAFFERLSYSILANSGVGDLATPDKDEYVRIAAALAADRDRRLVLREGLREQMKSGPLGQTEQFARDFYDLIARTVAETAAASA
ncbi:tetratricopeptide repeat protein [Phenylobacterium sp.]|jgi:predicted O-linked N-acetylglucosamine transferase (SPINDLY family)|uniref:tetratricopeptide repeat protein n=1 Tax=Phenylobacterium sp. TaxID=1871053 RepID=UPI002F403E9A